MSHYRHQKYWQRFLLPGESIVFCFGVSGAYLILFWMIPAMVMTALAIYSVFINLILGFLLGIVAVSVYLPVLYRRYFVHYAITDRRVMTREGLLHKTFVTADLPSVTDVTIDESFLERVLTGTGIVGINTAGSNRVELHFDHVKRPFALRKEIYRNQYKVIEERKLMSLQKDGYSEEQVPAQPQIL
jgi:membrane protein YdbS with pleckstrin-like domain